MTQGEAQGVVVGAAILSAGVVGWSGIKHGGKAAPSLRVLTAGSLLTAILLMAASVAPDLAAGFAVLIAISVALSRTGK